MASAAGLTLREAILPIKTTIVPSELRTVKVENSWDDAGENRYYKMYLPVCDDPANKELFIYVIEQFFDAAHDERLHLDDGAVRYSKFRQVLDGSLRLEWQTISDARGNNKTVDNFTLDVHTLLGRHLSPTSREDQLSYLRSIVKPFNMTVAEASLALTVMGKMGRWLLGSWTAGNIAMNELFANDQEKKRQLFQLMPMKYRVELAKSGHTLEDANYTYSQLTQYMSLQEAIERNDRGRKRTRGDGATSGGRGRGRGRGRGHGGRGFGRDRYGRSYHPYQDNRDDQGGRNPFIRAAQGGRIGGNPPAAPPAGRGRGGPPARGAGNRYPPRRALPPRMARNDPLINYRGQRGRAQQGQRRGGGNYMAEEQDHYYSSPAPPAMAASSQEQRYDEGYYGDKDYHDHYYGDDLIYDSNDHYYQEQEDHYYGQEEEQYDDAEQEPEDHFLQDFGY